MKYLLTVISLLAVSSTGAFANLVTNGSFETASVSFGGDGGARLNPGDITSLPGWTVITRDIALLENANVYGLTATSGNYFLDLTGYTDGAPYGGVSQSISGLAVGHSYLLTYDLMTDVGSALYGGTVGTTATVFGKSLNCIFAPPSSPMGNQVKVCSDSFTASAGDTTLSIAGLEGYQYIGLDNVDLEPTATPEPSNVALTLLASSAVLVLAAARSRKRSSSLPVVPQ